MFPHEGDHAVGDRKEDDLHADLVDVTGEHVVEKVETRDDPHEGDRAEKDGVEGLTEQGRTDEARPQTLSTPALTNFTRTKELTSCPTR